MQMSDAVEVVQVAGATNANEKLAEGWKLLAVLPGANDAGKALVMYVLGRGSGTPVNPGGSKPTPALGVSSVRTRRG